jgi:translation initiation factor IF-3
MPPRPRFDRRAPVRELPNINERISYPQLRVVDADGSQLGVISREQALEVAQDRELDLVLVSEKADPPVCRIMDYGKYKFEQEKKAKEAKKKSHQTEVKEVKMRYKIDQHDYDVRIGQAVRFLKSGDKVKCTVIFRGREIQHTALAEQLLMRMAKDLEESAEIQQEPKREGRNMIMFLSPRKTPLAKEKEAAAAASKAVRTIETPRQAAASAAAAAQNEGLNSAAGVSDTGCAKPDRGRRQHPDSELGREQLQHRCPTGSGRLGLKIGTGLTHVAMTGSGSHQQAMARCGAGGRHTPIGSGERCINGGDLRGRNQRISITAEAPQATGDLRHHRQGGSRPRLHHLTLAIHRSSRPVTGNAGPVEIAAGGDHRHGGRQHRQVPPEAEADAAERPISQPISGMGGLQPGDSRHHIAQQLISADAIAMLAA